MKLTYTYTIHSTNWMLDNKEDDYMHDGPEILKFTFREYLDVEDCREVAQLLIKRYHSDDDMFETLDDGDADDHVIYDALYEDTIASQRVHHMLCGSDLFVLHNLKVNEEFRGQGIGTRIMNRIHTLIQDHTGTFDPAIMLIPGAFEIPHEQAEARQRADKRLEKFYKRFGFKQMSKNYNVMYNYKYYCRCNGLM